MGWRPRPSATLTAASRLWISPVGGGLALSAHEATARAAINLSPEPVPNIVVSLAEDVVAFSKNPDRQLASSHHHFPGYISVVFPIDIAPRMVRLLKGAIS